ncbi:MAG TPA: hydrogenase accessory protein HypB, partial [candidate division WOR-3 bacterium]|nr:hydrogenase accessory protein HypB [candidate division WOR-3 bacterium]
IENVGNLVCPAEFDTGADKNVVIVSLPEGEDKPLKYPLMFRISSVLLVNKIDLASVLDADKKTLHRNALQVNPNLQIFDISAKTGEGFDAWLKWIEAELRKKRQQ